MSQQEPFYLIREPMLVKVKKRDEKHGDTTVAAYDLVLAGAFANAILAKLNPELRPALYTMEQGDLIDTTAFHTLKFPELGVFTWALEMGRISIELHDADDERNDLYLTMREADKFHFSLLPGGTVNFGLRVKLGQVDDEDDLLRLLRADNQKLLVSMHQSSIEEAVDNFEQAERITQEPKSEARKEAEKAFVNPIGAQSPEELLAEPDFSDPPQT